jgi:hypothetical protein
VLQDRSGSTLDLLNVVNIEDININTASPEHLRRALRSRNKQFEELTSYMLGREEAWSAEQKALEKKITGLRLDLLPVHHRSYWVLISRIFFLIRQMAMSVLL